MMELKRNDFVVGFLMMTVVLGLMYQGFYSLTSVDALASPAKCWLKLY